MMESVNTRGEKSMVHKTALFCHDELCEATELAASAHDMLVLVVHARALPELSKQQSSGSQSA